MGASTADLSIRRESLISAGSNVLLVLVNVATLWVLARALGASGLGVYFYALSAAIIAIIPSRELSEIMRKRVSEVDSPNAEFVGLAQVGTALYLALFGAALLLFAPTLVARTPLTGPTVGALGIYTAVLTQSALSTRLYDAVGSPGASMVSQSVRETVFLGGVVALVVLDLAAAETVLLLRAGVHLAAALGIYAVVGIVPTLPSRASLSSGFEFGKWSFPTGIASHLWEQAPTLLLGALLGGSAVALFETAKRVTSVGAYLATCINDPLLVKVSAMGSPDRTVRRYVRLALDYTPSVAIPAAVLMAPVASEIMVVAAGPAFATGGLALVGVALIHVFSGLKTPLAAAIHGVDEPQYVFYLTAGTLLAGAPAVVLAASVGGVNAVVLALVGLELVGALAAEVAARYALGRFVLPETLHQQVGAAAVAGTFVWLASHAVDTTSVRSLALLLGTGSVLHYGLFALTCEQFRTGTARTLRDLGRLLETLRPA